MTQSVSVGKHDANQKRSSIDAVRVLAAIKRGDKAAEQELVLYYSRSLSFILSRRCGDSELAADLVQDTFVTVILRARKGEINNPDALSAFIRQTGINLMLGYFRKKKRQATESVGEHDIDLPDLSNDVYKEISGKQKLALVSQVLEELPTERDKEIIKLYFGKEVSKDELCARFGINKAHFDRVLYRARNRLKQLIQFKLGTNLLDE